MYHKNKGFMLEYGCMETLNNKNKSININYRHKLFDLVKKNRLYLIIGSASFFFIISLLLTQIFKQAPMKANKYGSNLKNNNLSQKIDNLNFISPIKPYNNYIENGQISAIKSDKVTYAKNKYIVQKGDSLATIALKAYGDRDSWVRIVKANNLLSPDHIEVGMELILPR